MTSLEKLIADPWLPVEGQLALPSRKPRVVLSLRAGGERAQHCLDGSPPAGEFVWSNSERAIKAYQDPPLPGVVVLVTRGHGGCHAALPDALLAHTDGLDDALAAVAPAMRAGH